MTSPHCDFLDHARLRHTPELRAQAVDLLFEIALGGTRKFRLEFDSRRLMAVLGDRYTDALFPGPPIPARGGLERREGWLDEGRDQLLRRVVSFASREWPESPINYIEKVVLFDDGDKVILSASDSAEFILFELPPDARDMLIERYTAAGIPTDTIQPVDVNIDDTASG